MVAALAPWLVATVVLLLALAVDWAVGEPPASLHPTVWIGRAASWMDAHLAHDGPAFEMFEGLVLAVVVVGVPTLVADDLLFLVYLYAGPLLYIIAGALVLKATFAVRSMGSFTRPIADAASRGDYAEARRLLRHVVRRDPEELTDQQVLSATVETIAEGTVDGVTGPLFLYSLLGVPGAVAYRAINTLDSTVGYRDRAHLYTGRASAKMDTLVNFVPARLTGMMTVASARILGFDWSRCSRVLARDHSRTESLNAGWSMSAMAGALGLLLEKPGHYALGDSSRPIEPEDVGRALRIMRLNVVLFTCLVCLPLIILLEEVLPLIGA